MKNGIVIVLGFFLSFFVGGILEAGEKSEKLILGIKGMKCSFCAEKICEDLKKKENVQVCSIDLKSEKGAFEFNPAKTSKEKVKSVIQDAGFEVFLGSPDGGF